MFFFLGFCFAMFWFAFLGRCLLCSGLLCSGAKRDVKAKHSNKPIGFTRTLVFYEGSNTRKENRTNWIMHEYHRNKDPLLKVYALIINFPFFSCFLIFDH